MKPAARSLIVAPRLPAPPKVRTGNPFTDDADVVAECETCRLAGGRRYHLSGTRAHVKLALAEHHRQYHPDEVGVILLNAPDQ